LLSAKYSWLSTFSSNLFAFPQPKPKPYFSSRLSLKKAFKTSPHSFWRTPRSTFTLWFKPLSSNNLNFDSTAPNFGSSVP